MEEIIINFGNGPMRIFILIDSQNDPPFIDEIVCECVCVCVCELCDEFSSVTYFG